MNTRVKKLLTTAFLGTAVTVSLSAADFLFGSFEKPDSLTSFYTSKQHKWAVCGGKHSLTSLHATEGKQSMMVIYKGNPKKSSWPATDFTLLKNYQDVSKWKYLAADIYNVQEKEVVLWCRFTGIDKEGAKVVYHASFRLKPGMNNLFFEMKQNAKAVRLKPKGNVFFPWTGLENMNFYLNCPKEETILYYDNVRFTNNKAVAPAQKKTSDRSVKAVRFAKAPVIDGDLSDPCWKNAVPTAVFRNNMTAEKAKQKTYALLGYDNEAFYAAVVCYEKEPLKLRTKCDRYEIPVCNDDSVEIFLSPGQKMGEYYQFTANSGKGHCDTASYGNAFHTKQFPRWDHAVKIEKDRYIYECRIPFGNMRFYSGKKTDWRINIARNSKASAPELLSLFPTIGNLHQVDKFGSIIGMEPDLKKLSLLIEEFDKGKGILGKNQAEISVSGLDRSQEYLLNLNLVPDKRPDQVISSCQQLKFRSAANAKAEATFTYTLPEHGRYLISGYLSDKSGNIRSLLPVKAITTAESLEVKFLKPHYKDAVFATQNLKQAETVFTFNSSSNLYKNSVLHAVLKDAKGKTLAEKKFSVIPSSGTLNWKFDISKLKTGSYTVSGEWRNQKGTLLGKASRRLRILPPHPYEVRIAENGNIIVNGKGFFPIMPWYGEDYDVKRKAGINATYFFGGWGPVSKDINLIKGAYKAGFGAWMSIAATTIQKDYFSETKLSSVEKKLTNLVKSYRQQPGLLGYEILDEPQCYFNEPLQSWLDAKKLIDDLDPHHPVRLTQNAEGSMSAAYGSVCDIYGMDYYPGYVKNGLCRRPMSTTANKVRYLRKILPGYKSIIPVFQAYDRIGNEGVLNGRFSNYRETRLLAYSCIAEGANGIEFWCWKFGYYSYMPERVEYSGLKAVMQEISAMSEILLAEHGEVSSPDAGTETHFCMRKYKNDLYLIACNSSLSARKLRFNSPALKNINKLYVMGENRTVPVVNGVITDQFDRYGVHVYTTAKNPPYTESIAENEKEQQRIIAEFEKKNASDLFYAARHRGKLDVTTRHKTMNAYLNMFDGMNGSYLYLNNNKIPSASFEISCGRSEKIGRITLDIEKAAPLKIQAKGWIQGKWVVLAEKSFPAATHQELVFQAQTMEKILITVSTTEKGGNFPRLDNLRAFSK
ncbi:MAG: hypothetical protein IKB25_07200 [Lentisphaeria bacterium]|nr:hypothetical protein [Lentisphaeria bacterium]